MFFFFRSETFVVCPRPDQRRTAADLVVGGDDHPDAVALHHLHRVERRLRHPAVEHAPDEEPHLAADGGAVGLDNLRDLFEEGRLCPLDAPAGLLHQRATSRWRGGRVSPRRFAISRSFSIAFPGISISFGQTSVQRLQVVQ